jgi:hypothetical protein
LGTTEETKLLEKAIYSFGASVTGKDNETRIREYLLGRATRAELDALEAEYFEDDGLFALVSSMEEELIRDYLARELRPEDREQFEAQLLALPALKETVRRHEDFLNRVTTVEARTGPRPDRTRLEVVPIRTRSRVLAWSVPLAAAAGIVLIWGTVAVRERKATSPTEALNTKPAEISQVVLDLPLSPGVDMGPATRGHDLIVNEPGAVIRLQLETPGLEGRPAGLRAVVRQISGGVLWTGSASPNPANPALQMEQIEIASSALPVGEYVVELFSPGPDGAKRFSYYFRRIV